MKLYKGRLGMGFGSGRLKKRETKGEKLEKMTPFKCQVSFSSAYFLPFPT